MAELVDNTQSTNRQLEEKWTLWVHLPSDPDWTLKGYYKIHTFSTIDDIISIIESTPHSLVKGAMMFIMRAGVTPIWEDKNNKNGGCFSYRVSHKILPSVWRKITYTMIGGGLMPDEMDKTITGISISPKKQFSVLKIWTSTKEHTDPKLIVPVQGLSPGSCLFKSHVPEY